ncbi:MAG TPA: PilZ domain-containing protein, partial [Terriglobales bacterium]|nr:PilZ domain-containing protein [Terriglobales bacterium]
MQPEHPNAANPAGQRSSDRIRYAFRLHVAGSDSSGYQFSEPIRTEVVTRDGGLIVCPIVMNVGDVITLVRGDKQVKARIVGQVGILKEEQLYGIQFLESMPAFWGITFSEHRQEAAGRAVLECGSCSMQQVLPLGEIEMLVFESTKVVAHDCARCGRQTLWMAPSILGEPELLTGADAYKQADESGRIRVRRSPSVNDRKYQRISMRNTKACIRRPGYADDVVDVLDLSRGGVHFFSQVDYVKGTMVDVAVPYTNGGANVFVPAEIVRIQCRPTSGIPGDF